MSCYEDDGIVKCDKCGEYYPRYDERRWGMCRLCWDKEDKDKEDKQ